MRLPNAQQLNLLMTILILSASKIKMALTSLDAHHLYHLFREISLQNLHNFSPICFPFLIISLMIVHSPYLDHKCIIFYNRTIAFLF